MIRHVRYPRRHHGVLGGIDLALEQPVVGGVDGASDLESASDEELAVLLELETIQDLDVIANLEMLERLMAVEEGTS